MIWNKRRCSRSSALDSANGSLPKCRTLPAVGGVQTHDAAAERGFARAGLADDAERLAFLDLESDTIDRLDHLPTAAAGKRDLKLVDRQDFGHAIAPCSVSAS